jgi:hypothetical protein
MLTYKTPRAYRDYSSVAALVQLRGYPMNTIYLDARMVPAQLRGDYAGKKFKAVVTESVIVPMTAGLWDGGSRDLYYAIGLETGRNVEMPGQRLAPTNERRTYNVALEPGIAIVEHSTFCGQDAGLTFYVHPDNAAKLLPAPVELSPVERLVLVATASLKSSYAGRDRYTMAQDEYHCRKVLGDSPYPSREEWNATKAALAARGFLNKAGAITPAGRNAAKA